MLLYPACFEPEDAFEIHPERQLKGVGNGVVSTLRGCWNEEAVVDHIEEYKRLTEHFGRYGAL